MVVSPDGKTLTYTVHEKGHSQPLMFVYDREKVQRMTPRV